MSKFQGITKKTMSNGEINIFVRFKHLSKTYPVKNFTKLYGCKTETQAKNKLEEIKVLISQGKNPFLTNIEDLNYLFYKRLKEKLKNKEWEENTTAKRYKEFYIKYIENSIGHLKISKITYSHLDVILKKLSSTKCMNKKTLKNILNPIFTEQIKYGEIQNNPCDLLPKQQKEKREKITNRVENEDFLYILKELYNTIKNYNFYKKDTSDEFKNFFMLMLLTTHRYGELIQLTNDNINIKNKFFISNEEITKTNEIYKFPIPCECLEYISKNENGKIFPNIKYGAVYGIFLRIVKKSKILVYKNKTLSPHDIRRLFLNLMIKKGFDSRLVDFCLEHKQNDVIEHYLDLSYSSKKEVFEKYWELIRN